MEFYVPSPSASSDFKSKPEWEVWSAPGKSHHQGGLETFKIDVITRYRPGLYSQLVIVVTGGPNEGDVFSTTPLQDTSSDWITTEAMLFLTAYEARGRCKVESLTCSSKDVFRSDIFRNTVTSKGITLVTCPRISVINVEERRKARNIRYSPSADVGNSK